MLLVCSGWCWPTCPAGLTWAVQGWVGLQHAHAAFLRQPYQPAYTMQGRWAPPAVLLPSCAATLLCCLDVMLSIMCRYSCGNAFRLPAASYAWHFTDRHENLSLMCPCMLQELAEMVLSERTCTGQLTSHPQSRDIQFENFSLLFHGHELIQDSTLELNYGR